ncbi:hypothetical protein STRIP9103_08302 [Streptomyces ipomoeae 91-03]|uniref:Uncharacterized protein n=1 Tax=Streptomyces ipomoeae 91-03 TaxID=698759 RepID=L1KI51_9ACTN|nr:hypothetical protein STRIP9103_08302 [Streptomyces ipomoeae 91-03]
MKATSPRGRTGGVAEGTNPYRGHRSPRENLCIRGDIRRNF